ncbi:Z1 domain-containing protein [Rhizobium sp. CF142]|uniref:Z1 domain-containing protein n=1 Tax=Rhizobium sp. CF142 TaxID=1144314 RepID=UPI00026EFEFD|nr:Z1 domain-containing protein [Rhizobium sp. CF142]EJJ28681.1 primosomal protein N' (replication factor Y) - superfamily II helicase [Rhizobium sp. CF142]
MDWKNFVGNVGNTQYIDRIRTLNARGITTNDIEFTVEGAVKNIKESNTKAFVIFGEPQSGKTEMMIALNARLLDEGCDVIVNLLTDSVDLLMQSLSRFRQAGLSPSPKQFSELPVEARKLKGKQWIIFSKKNARDLEKLKESLRFMKKVIIIDDEADYATPNSKVNIQDRTKINSLIYGLLGENGVYVGVTATPARLDLNNTFDNNTEKWINFKPHAAYVGQDFFFPKNGQVSYRLFTFPAGEGSERVQLRNAIFHFLCGVAEQHQRGVTENFSMLVHTSGKMDEHSEDVKVIHETIDVLSDPANANFDGHCAKLLSISKEYNPDNPESVVEFVLRNINKNQVFVVNSRDKKSDIVDLLKPSSLFCFGAGGNIISRGVTFENLLSMYFTRSVKGKFTQDTYIQRARMFGARNRYKEFFQLWIPYDLIENWSKCFAFHKLAVEAIRSGKGAPVWLSDHKTAPTSAASIDRSSVDFEGGEMSFAPFDFDIERFNRLMAKQGISDEEKLIELREALPGDLFPSYVFEYISSDASLDDGSVCFHNAGEFGGAKSNYTDEEIENIRRSKGIFSTNEFARGPVPGARHHLKMFYNKHGKARLFYKINGKSVKFMQNRR